MGEEVQDAEQVAAEDLVGHEVGGVPEHLVAARQIGHVDIGVHRMRFPSEEDDRVAGLLGAGDLRQHPLLRAFDDLECAEAELVRCNHARDRLVGWGAGLDTVDLAVEFSLVGIEISKILPLTTVEETATDHDGFAVDTTVGDEAVRNTQRAWERDVTASVA